MTQIPSGWYPDPAPPLPGQPPMVRYWDGRVWTEHVTPAVPAAPMPPATPVYATTPAAAVTGPTTPDGERLAGWWWRALAFFIDGILVGLVSNIVSLPAQLALQEDLTQVVNDFTRELDQNPNSNPDIGAFLGDYLDALADHALWLFLPGIVLTLLYHTVMLRWKGATLGKLATGLRVRLRERPGQLSWGTVLVRVTAQYGVPYALAVLAVLSGSLAGASLFGLAYAVYFLTDNLWPTWDPKKQALHDKAARTNVVKVR
jgi:uncharacterized RDD family membrane protein YckC